MSTVEASPNALIGTAPPSPAGPLSEAEAQALPLPPMVDLPKRVQLMRFTQRQTEFVFRNRRELGEVFRVHAVIRGRPAITSHPDHIRSLFTAKPDQAPSLTAESPLRPVLGPNSVLTANGGRHMRQRKLLLPPFHGESISAYERMIHEATERGLDRWPIGEPIALAPRMQSITLDVIMGGIFGVEGEPQRGTPEFRLKRETQRILEASVHPLAKLGEYMNIGKAEPVGLQKIGLGFLDRATYALIRKRRAADDVQDRRDVLSLLINARTEEGEALTDRELRDELLTLVLAGHETTANQLAWTWERLVRNPAAHERLLAAVREDDGADDVVEQTIQESMRNRPVIPVVGRRVQVPWRLGDFKVPAGSPISMSILLLHHREDVYPDPFAFRPERWVGTKPGTYTWIPFGGGTRRCLGAALAMVEQRIVLAAMARRLDLTYVDPEPERAQNRNVTMIPARGGRVVVRSRR